MGLLSTFRNAAALVEHKRLALALSTLQTHGLSDLEAGSLLVVQEWALPQSWETSSRTALLSKKLGDFLLDFLVFSRRLHLSAALNQGLFKDPFFERYGCFYSAARPLTSFAREHMQRLWNNEPTRAIDLADAGLAAFYATLIAPVATSAWLILAELKPLGFCPVPDKRDHIKEGSECARRFLRAATLVDPEFRSLLEQGITELAKMGGESRRSAAPEELELTRPAHGLAQHLGHGLAGLKHHRRTVAGKC